MLCRSTREGSFDNLQGLLVSNLPLLWIPKIFETQTFVSSYTQDLDVRCGVRKGKVSWIHLSDMPKDSSYQRYLSYDLQNRVILQCPAHCLCTFAYSRDIPAVPVTDVSHGF